MRIPPLPEALDNYNGWLPSPVKAQIPRVPSDISPKDMWDYFISQRRPVIIDGHLTDPGWQGSKWTDLDYLKQKAGKVPVKIEPVHPSSGHFGTSAKRKQVPFADYLDLLEDPQSAGKWYLTTQYTEDEEREKQGRSSRSPSDSDDEEPEQDTVLPSPTNALSNDFPKSPELLGSLVLQQCNLWLGNSKEGKSSGLHHDFHDNLYVLLSGYKRFLLFPPNAHRFLQPRGLIDRVHANGLIVYAPPGQLPSYLKGGRTQMPIRPDGLVPSDAARWRCKSRLRIKRMIDEQAATDAGEGPRAKQHRKGKAKQTRAQELAEIALQQAEMELRLCRMDEEGITNEYDYEESEEEDDDDDEEEEEAALSVEAEPVDTAQDFFASIEPESDDSDQETRNIIDSLPEDMKAVAMLALRGDQMAAQNLREYLASLTDGSDEEESDEDAAPAEHNAVAELGSADLSDDTSASGREPAGTESEDEDATSLPASRKRNIEARTALSNSHSDSDPSDSARLSPANVRSGKKVKIASVADTIPEPSDPEDSLGEEESDDSADSGAEGLPLFADGDSGSEFGDVEAGEAELESFLAASGPADAEGESEDEEEDEPPSFSKIPPSVLHKYYGVPPFTAEEQNTTDSSADAPMSLWGCPVPVSVLLHPGQMLYLPASWYHEVTSSSSLPRHLSSSKRYEQESSKVHMALNYWFHPPDALDFEPVEVAPSSSAGQNGDIKEPFVPGIGANIGQSAIENLRGGTGTHERPYRDAEVWDEVARAVDEQFEKAKQEASKWASTS